MARLTPLATLADRTWWVPTRQVTTAAVRAAIAAAAGGAVEDRAGLVGVVADGDHSVEGLGKVAVEGLALVAGYVDAQLGHGLDGEWPDVGCLGAGGEGGDAPAGEVVQQPFSHLAA